MRPAGDRRCNRSQSREGLMTPEIALQIEGCLRHKLLWELRGAPKPRLGRSAPYCVGAKFDRAQLGRHSAPVEKCELTHSIHPANE